MGRRGKKDLLPPVQPNEDAQSLKALMRTYLLWSLSHGYTEATVKTYRIVLEALLRWLADRGVLLANEVTKPVLERYQQSLFLRKSKRTGTTLRLETQSTHLSIIQGFFRFLARQNLLLYDPASSLELPRLGKRLPRTILTEAEVEIVLAQAELTKPQGLRDRAMLEILYSTGMRRLELVHLDIDDLRPEAQTLFIREGKGKRDRLVPTGERALQWLTRYLGEARPQLLTGQSGKALFLAQDGERIDEGWLTHLAHEYVRKANIGKTGACHLLRHTMATLMLSRGASIRHIQEMLGHSDLKSTQLYTRVSIDELRRVHSKTHPGALPRARSQGQGQALEDEGLPSNPEQDLAELLDELTQDEEEDS